MSYQDRSAPSVKHQQQGGMTLVDFAALHSMSVKEAWKFAAEGKILGANRDSRSNRWTIYPPAKLLVTIKRQANKRGTPFADRQVTQAMHDVKLLNATQKFKVMLSGAQILAIESNLSKAAEKLKRRCFDVDDFDDDTKASYGEKLNLIFTVLAELKQAAREASACCGKLPPSVRAAGALRAGFPTATVDRSSDITEARAGAHGFIVGIPEGGNSPAPSGCIQEEPAFFLPGAFAVYVEHAGRPS